MTLEPELDPTVERSPDQRPIPGLDGGFLVEQTHSGPLPPAYEFAGYERVLPGAAERILKMAEREMERRIEADRAADERDKAVVAAEVKIATRAQLGTMVVVMSFVALFAYAVANGLELAGVAAGIAALATIIYALNGGRSRRSRGAADTETKADSENGQ